MPESFLSVDIGNTAVTIGRFTGDRVGRIWRLSSFWGRTSDEISLILRELLEADGDHMTGGGAVGIASVVPQLTEPFSDSCRELYGERLAVVDHGVTSGDELPTTPIRVLLRQYGSGEQDYAIRIEQRAQRPNDFRELAEALEALRESAAFTSDSQLIVVADGNVRWDHLVNGFNAALVARFKNISLGTQ